MAMKGQVTVSDYTVIRVKYRDSESSAPFSLWIKRAESDTQSPRVIVSGVPVFVNENSLRKIFRSCGSIKSVSLRKMGDSSRLSHLREFKPTVGYHEAVIDYKTKGGAENALCLPYDGDFCLCDQDETLPAMADVWTSELANSYNMDTKKLADDCTEYMKIFDSKQTKVEKRNKNLVDQPDEEGWVTVTRTKFYHPPKALKAHELRKLKKHKQEKSLLNFYSSQVADSKMQRIRELKAKFEEDKKRIQEMKQQRKFKPY